MSHPKRKASRALLSTVGLLVSLAVAPSPASAAPDSVALPGEAAYPESITATADGTVYVSSFASGGVVRVKPGASEGEVWIEPGAFGTRSTFGVLAEEKAGLLWVCSNDLSALGVKGRGRPAAAATARTPRARRSGPT